MDRQWDVVVVGAGAAGLSAAREAAAAGLSCACIDPLGAGGLVMNLGPVRDCPEAAAAATGADLAASLMEEAMEAGAELVFGEVSALTVAHGSGGMRWRVRTDGEEHGARAVIVATGLSAGSLGIADEARFAGRGLSHCAACDGPLFAGESVVVAGDDRWTVAEAEELARVAGRVTLVGDRAALGPAAERLAAAGRIAFVPGRIVGLAGEGGLEQVSVAADGEVRAIDAAGLFAYLGRRPALDFAAGQLPRDGADRIVVDEADMACVPFLFAAGDVRAGSPETVSAAIADGRRAGRAAASTLSR
ncbi:MAG: NAD(P)/FAD-dependent oxidoreductase [Alphaproteobacteria bacterium]